MDPIALRPAVDVIAAEIGGLLRDRQVCDRFAGVVRSNDALLREARHGNAFLVGVRRWWATAAALVLRRHVDGGNPATLRAVLEILVERGDFAPGASFENDLAQITAISERFRPYLNALIHGGHNATALTFDDLSVAIDTVRDIGQRVYAAVANVSRPMNPPVESEWTDIFRLQWIADSSEPMAYILGNPGVPYDAVPMTKADAAMQPRIDAVITLLGDESLTIALSNVGPQPALDVRAFLPFAGTVIDHDHLDVGASIDQHLPVSPQIISGQAVIEFENVHGEFYRQYADVASTGRLRRIDRNPYRVSARIVAPAGVRT